MDMDVETAWQADLSDVAAGMVQRHALLTEMLDNWLDDYLALRLQLHCLEQTLDEHFGGVMPEYQRKQLRQVHDKIDKIFGAAYLARIHCPMVNEFFLLLEYHKFDGDDAAEWLSDPEKCLTVPSWHPALIKVIGMITERVKLESKLQPPVDPKNYPPDPDTPLFSEDYRSGRWKNYRFTFSTKQAAVMQKLHSHWLQGTPEVSKDVLLDAAGSDASALRDLFRGHIAWKTLIISGTGSGLWRLAPESP
jgi:hypothetical protein